MNNRKKRNKIAYFVYTVVSVALLNGCVGVDSSTMNMFAADLLRSTAAALLL